MSERKSKKYFYSNQSKGQQQNGRDDGKCFNKKWGNFGS